VLMEIKDRSLDERFSYDYEKRLIRTRSSIAVLADRERARKKIQKSRSP